MSSSEPPLVFLRDLADVEPPRDRYAHYDEEDIYRLVPRPQWTGLEDEIWTPRSQEHDPQLEKVKALMKRNLDTGANGDASPSGMNTLNTSKFASKLKSRKKRNPRVKVREFLNNKCIDGMITFFILWSLFMEDLRVVGLPKAADYPIWYFHIFVMFSFAMEMVLRMYSVRGYAWGFYFSLDLLATVTVLFDFLPLFQTTSADSGGTTDAFRTAKSARAGTKIARLVRVIRVIRVIRLLVTARGVKKASDKEEEQQEDEGAPSELSKALQGQIAKKVIVFVLGLLLGSVAIEFVWWGGIDPGNLGDTRIRQGMAQLFTSIAHHRQTGENIDGEPFKTMRLELDRILDAPLKTDAIWTSVYTPIYKLEVMHYGPERKNLTFWPVPKVVTGDPDSYALPNSLVDGSYYLDPSEYSTLSGEGTQMTSWVPAWPSVDSHWPDCEWLYLDHYSPNVELCPNARGPRGSFRDLRLIGPAEIMKLPFTPGIELATKLGIPELANEAVIEVWYGRKEAEFVTATLSILLIILIVILLLVMGFLFSRDVDQMVIRPIESMVDSVTKLAANPAYKLEVVHKVQYETDALKMSLGKIATMLQVGFGEAGNNLVAENLRKGDTVDPMVPGRKLLGAYGFCIIDDYEEVLECLGEEILPFTNTAASIVHDAVTDNGGQPNRNLGEAFLCVWKPDVDPESASKDELASSETKMCDGALTAFRRCVRGIAMSAPLQAYNQHDEIVKFFDGNYTTRIGYGLHYGWAIEGAVGTNIKIDCSYLSPNVNLAARLESATKMYGVNVLMSESFHDKLSTAVKQGLRRVDVVCLKGSSIPMAIYTCDRSNALYVASKAMAEYGADRVVGEFQRIFEEGMDEFVAGNWQGAKGLFETALSICPRDKPSQRILMHMDTPENHPDYGLATTPFVAPEGWPGYHILLSK